MQTPLWLLRILTLRRLRREPTLDIRAISPRLSHDHKVISLLILNRPDNFLRVAPGLYNDIQFAKHVVSLNPLAYEFASPLAHADLECTLLALQFCPANLRFAALEMRNEVRVVLAAIRAETFLNSPIGSSPSLELAGPDVKKNPDVLEYCRGHVEWKSGQAARWADR